MKALKKWSKMPEDWKETFLNNVFCSNCKLTSIVGYAVGNDAHGIELQGKCVNCGRSVARYVEE